MKKGNIFFCKADLAMIVLASVPMTWQNQYNLNHSMVLESMRALLPDLEAIECIMDEKHNKNSRQKVRLLQPQMILEPDASACLGSICRVA
jgi:hypothetical protein